MKQKKCGFPKCESKFDAIGPLKYCEEHRKPQYRSFLNKLLIKRKRARSQPIENVNQIIKHNSIHEKIKQFTCALKGCNKKFEIKLSTYTDIYPKFCPVHMNKNKRELHRLNEKSKK